MLLDDALRQLYWLSATYKPAFSSLSILLPLQVLVLYHSPFCPIVSSSATTVINWYLGRIRVTITNWNAWDKGVKRLDNKLYKLYQTLVILNRCVLCRCLSECLLLFYDCSSMILVASAIFSFLNMSSSCLESNFSCSSMILVVSVIFSFLNIRLSVAVSTADCNNGPQ